MFVKKCLYRDITIYIPSKSRSEKIYTPFSLSKKALKHTALVVHPSEFKTYKKHNPNINIIQNEAQGISAVRNNILLHCPTRYCIMLDDDLKFGFRLKGDWHIILMKPEDRKLFDVLIHDVMSYVRKHNFAHASLSMRELGHPGKIQKLAGQEWCYNERYTRFFLFDTHQLKKVKLRRVEVMEDFDIILQLLRQGKPCAVSYKWVQGQAIGSNAKGGCSTYRTPEVQTLAANKLAKLHPGIVKVVRKKTKCAWGWGERTDVQIAWKKAFLSSGMTMEKFLK